MKLQAVSAGSNRLALRKFLLCENEKINGMDQKVQNVELISDQSSTHCYAQSFEHSSVSE